MLEIWLQHANVSNTQSELHPQNYKRNVQSSMKQLDASTVVYHVKGRHAREKHDFFSFNLLRSYNVVS